ncbi:MAG: DNA-binding protein [Deltaproteobacteria bacterium HGW-Deltaproteobacteria-11]|nr:MAG: DNA-binding protein [Deltaproteobacteria bacterium HGW-Deltaproteobacteria-11]
MSVELMNTKEVAKYLDIHEKQVYALIKAKRIPATRITGKWIFPRKLIDEWVESRAGEGLTLAKQKSNKIAGALLAAGSNDPVLDILQTWVRKAYPDLYLFSANMGSMNGLAALDNGHTDIAWSHLLDPESGKYNVPYLSALLPRIKAVVVNLFYREIGFITAPDNPHCINWFDNLARESLKFINRQKGSGTRVLLDHHLGQLGVSPDHINGYEREVYTHFEVGFSILSGEADVGIATAAVSKLLGLSFVPITRESFDMVLDQSTFFQKGVQAFMDVLDSREFRKGVEKLGSYDFRDSGKILYSTV